MIKKGTILLCGLPNVGKSTLINNFAKKEISIVSYKPQTTRKKNEYYFKNEKYEIIILDTPGFHLEKNQLDKFMNNEITKYFKIANVVCVLYDLTKSIDNEAIIFLKEINRKIKDKAILIFTKSDLIEEYNLKNKIDILSQEIKKYFDFSKYIYISCFNNKDINLILENLNCYLIENNDFFLKENYDDNDKFLISEIIRKHAIDNLHNELPYGMHVEVEDYIYNENKNTLKLEVTLFCEKTSQKKIIIGSNGSMIKKISMHSRHELLKIFDCEIYLYLHVKILENWRNNSIFLKKQFK